MNKVVDFIKGSYEEMRNKVSWPKYDQLQESSLLVLVASLIFALMVGLIDKVINFGMTWIYQSF